MLVAKHLNKIIYLTALCLLAVFFVSKNADATTGMSVGNTGMTLGAGDSVYYGLTSSSNAAGNFIQLDKGSGASVFKVDYLGNITTTGTISGASLNLTGALNAGNISAGAFGSNTGGGNYSFPGNLGVGTSNPGVWKLKVNVGTDQNIGFRVFGGVAQIESVNDAGTVDIPLRLDATQYQIMSGNVGIGTTAPQTALTLSKANVAYAGQLQIASSDFSQITFYNSSALTPNASNRKAHIYTNMVDNTFQLANDVASAPLILQGPDSGAGNVGIGTTNPGYKLDVQGYGVFGNSVTSRGTYSNGLSIHNTNGTATSLHIWQDGIGSSHIGYRPSDSNLYIVNAYSDGLITNSAAITLGTTGNVGIGTTNPVYKLDVRASGASYFDQPVFVGAPTAAGHAATKNYVDSLINPLGGGGGTVGYWNASGANIYSINSGNVGIGTTAPNNKLEVAAGSAFGSGSSDAIAQFGVAGSGTWASSVHQVVIGGPSVLGYTGLTVYSDSTSGVGGIGFADGRGANDSWRGDVQYDHSVDAMTLWTNATEKVRITSTGSVGIGTTNPGAYKLYVNGDTNINGTLNATAYSGGSMTGTVVAANVSSGAFAGNTGGGNFSFPSYIDIAKVDSSNLMRLNYDTTNGGSIQSYIGGANAKTSINPGGGNVGIGMTAPEFKLDVNGDIAFPRTSKLMFAGPTPGDRSRSYFTGDGNNNVYLYGPSSNIIATFGYTGNVGIGTTGPKALLHIAQNDGAGDAVRAPIMMSRYWASDTDTRAVAIYNYYNSANVNDQLVFGVSGGGGNLTSPALYTNAKMVIQGNGNVGIGTTNPGAYKLNVNGDTNIAGTLTATTYAGGSMTGTVTAGNVSSGEFGKNTGGGNFIFGATVPGNVGIGTPNPGSKFQVYGDLTGPVLVHTGNAEATLASYQGASTPVAFNLAMNSSASSNSDSFGVLHLTRTNMDADGAGAGLHFQTKVYGGSTTEVAGMAGIITSGLSANTSVNGDLQFYTTYNGTTRQPKMRIASTGNVGIGTTAPQDKLDVNGSIRFRANTPSFAAVTDTGVLDYVPTSIFATTPQIRIGAVGTAGTAAQIHFLTGNSTTLADRMMIDGTGQVGIGTTTPSSTLHVNGGVTITNGDLIMTGRQITANKLSVNTIDPLYSIYGTNYASFAASIVGGVKEEVTGKINIDTKVGAEYEYVIDFDRITKGTDLWVWRQVIDFNKDGVEAQITPYGGFANTYYSILDNKIILRADRPVEVSYRFIGKRFDWKKWPTLPTDQTEKAGLIIKK